MRFAAALITGLVILSGLRAQYGPSGSPPALKVVQSVDTTKGHIVLIESVTIPVVTEVEKVVIINGQQATVKEKVYRFVTEHRTRTIDAGKSRIITPDGKQLPIDEVWKRVKAKTVIALSGDGNTPAPAYLKALNTATLVIVSPPPAPMVPNLDPVPEPKKLVPMPKKA